MWTRKELDARNGVRSGKWTDIEKDAACSLKAEGWTRNKIAYFLNRSYGGVCVILIENKSVIFAHDVS